MDKKEINEKIDFLLKKNRESGEFYSIIQLIVMIGVIISLILLMFASSTAYHFGLFWDFIIVIAVPITTILFIYLIMIDKTNETEKILRYAKYINKNWIKNNILEKEYHKFLGPTDMITSEKALVLLNIQFGVKT